MSEIVSIAVVSDLHFMDHDPQHDTTHVDLSIVRSERHDPMGDLVRLIGDKGLKADCVVTPGDLTVAAGAAGLQAAWSAVHKFKEALSASQVFAVTGNHDIVSRSTGEEPEIWERLKKLEPKYPSSALTEMERLRYWGDHFAVVKLGALRFVLLNTCNAHARGEKEYGHGRITDYIIDRIVEATPDDDQTKLNVLICHHHPIRYADLADTFSDYSEMAHGSRLLDSLASTDQPWLVIHGHKHFPKVTYAGGGSAAVTVFSAGSLSAILSPVYFSTAVNQFYILDIDLDDVAEFGLVGVVRAWDWIKGVGWVASEYRDTHPGRLVYGSGFGYHANVKQIAKDIDAFLGGESVMPWSRVVDQFRGLKYLLLEDRIRLVASLSSRGITSVNSSPLDPMQIIRAAL